MQAEEAEAGKKKPKAFQGKLLPLYIQFTGAFAAFKPRFQGQILMMLLKLWVPTPTLLVSVHTNDAIQILHRQITVLQVMRVAGIDTLRQTQDFPRLLAHNTVVSSS